MQGSISISILCTVVCCIITIANFFNGRKDKSTSETKEMTESITEVKTSLKYISKQVEDVAKKVDEYQRNIEEKIDKKITDHIRLYHNK